MESQIFFEDVSEGMELPVEVRNPTPRQLVQYAGASGDFYEIHYDRNFAQSTGLKDIIIHGALKNAMLGAYVTGWAGPQGSLCRLTVQYRGMDYPDEPITAKGHVTRVYQEGQRNLVDCTVWLENPEGQQTTPGTATVALPSRSN